MTTMTLAQIDKMPEVATSAIREMQWQIDWYAMAHKEAKASTDRAWKMYNDAIDADEPDKNEINALFEVATMFENIRKDAWRKWENAKRDYLAVMN